jgi:hypothetical protein
MFAQENEQTLLDEGRKAASELVGYATQDGGSCKSQISCEVLKAGFLAFYRSKLKAVHPPTRR